MLFNKNQGKALGFTDCFGSSPVDLKLLHDLSTYITLGIMVLQPMKAMQDLSINSI